MTQQDDARAKPTHENTYKCEYCDVGLGEAHLMGCPHAGSETIAFIVEPKPSPDNMRVAERLARKLELSWNADRPLSNEHVQRMYALNVPILAAALQAKDEKFDAMITTRDDALLDAEAALHASRAAPVNAMREALEFYADLSNYRVDYTIGIAPINRDDGERAIKALSSAPAVEPDGARMTEHDVQNLARTILMDFAAKFPNDRGIHIYADDINHTIDLIKAASPVVEQKSAWRDVLQKEAAYHCTYCADGREAEKHKGGWWHRVARGGDLGQLEPCKAHVVHSIRQRLIDTPPKPRIENP